MKEIIILFLGLLMFALYIGLVAIFIGNSKKLKKEKLNRELANICRINNGKEKPNEYAKYFEENTHTCKGWK